MSITIAHERYSQYERSYAVEMLQGQVFGAFVSVYQQRRDSVGLTNVEMAKRVQWTRSQVTKVFSEPQNFTLRTLAELSTMLDVDFIFMLVDKTDPARTFSASGISINIKAQSSQERNVVQRSDFPGKDDVLQDPPKLDVSIGYGQHQADLQRNHMFPEVFAK